MSERTRTIAKSGSIELIIKKSRFIVRSSGWRPRRAREQLQASKKRYWDANHNCSAWIIGPRGELRRSNDDGEPGGTAGAPMLHVLDTRGVTDTLAVVTRYFGGVLLGAGGLIRAYGQAVADALDEVGIVERVPLTVVAVEVDHGDAGRLENLLRHTRWRVSSIDYGAQVTFELPLGDEEIDPFRTWLSETTSGRCEAVEIGTEIVEVPL